MEFYGVIHPDYKEIRRLRSSKKTDYVRYYAFPAILHAEKDKVLVAHKNGLNHGWDVGAQVSLDQFVIDLKTQKVEDIQPIYCKDAMIPQMGEYVKMPNGDICVYIDMQAMDKNGKNYRTGMEGLRSKDGGRTWGESQRVGVIDGVEYGYPFDFCEKNGRVYMLTMTFANLVGSKNRRQVHVISSADNGETWRFEANLTETLGLEFNESSLIATEEGFALFTRGESARHQENAGSDAESEQCLVMFDDNFKVLRMRDYHATRNDFSLVGRPRIYAYRGLIWLITRQHINTNVGVRMALDLFGFDPKTLEIRVRFRLNDPVVEGQDGHYANLYLDETGDRTMLRVVDYLTCPTPVKTSIKRKPDIVQYSFDVDELIAQAKEETGNDF